MTETASVGVGPRSVRRVELSHTQQLILTGQRLHPDTPLANMGKLVRLHGAIEPDRFVRAVDAVVRACDVLRLAVDEASSTTGRILASPPRRTDVVDLPAAEIDEWVAARVDVPLDPTACVYDSVLVRHAEDEWSWWLDLHHVAVDAWSSALVYAATAVAYEQDGAVDAVRTVVADAGFELPPPEIDRERVAGWQTVLAGRDARPLAPYGPRGPATTRVDRLPIAADLDALVAALDDTFRSLSRELGLLAVSAMAFAHTVRRLDGRREIVVGVPVHHRNAMTRQVVAPLMEIYPLAVTADDDETPREQFKRVLRSLMQLLRTARPGESPGVTTDVVLNVVTAGYGDFAGIPTEVEWVRSAHVDADHVIRSQVFDYSGEGHLSWQLDVNHGLAADGSWRRLPDHVGAAVDRIVDAPDTAWREFDIVSPGEAAELAALERGAAIEVDRPVHLEIAEALRRDPTWVVAEDGGGAVEAGRFDADADAVACWLVSQGVTVGSRVGVRMSRGTDVLVAIHGVLRAGAAFVMLDPDDPRARHESIAADADLALTLDALPDTGDVRPVDLPTAELDDLAYVLYTSGSTGVPKGVPVTHRGLAGYLRFAADTYVDHERPVVALHSSLAFDLTITSLFLSFLTGGRTVVFPGAPVAALGDVADDDRITVLKATPSQLELFTRLADRRRSLRTVIVGGEAFRRPLAERMIDRAESGVRIFNEYGPTEAVVGCMIHEFDPETDVGADVPIGRAAPGCAIRVLDDARRRTAPGAWGELWVHRDGMVASYLHRPELSAERFVDLDGDGRRWYRTGDRVRVAPHGVAVYGGRVDDQLQVNGIRLEPGEVEAALVAHPRIDSALVRTWSPRSRSRGEVRRCARCGLGADVPGTSFDADGVCNVCRRFDAVEPQTRDWFRTEADLAAHLADIRSRHDGEIDALHLLSGGKDSTYALYQLVERGWRVHALTLDNGFISDGAKANIRRTVAGLGITHEFASTPVMNEIFRDSLDRYSNVCQGCYKTIYTIAVSRARELGIPVVVTGLSRGQFFETRLVPHQFERERFDPDEIDATVLEARRVYHRTPDAVTELLPEQAVFDEPDVFDHVEFLDFYRYVDVDLAEVYRFLEENAPWVRPADTGRSTNCLINVAGISVHRREQGYHNYAEPYSWDVRLGHKTRGEALAELDDDIDPDEVDDLLRAVGYEPKSNEILTAWYRTDDGVDLDPDELRRHLRRLLPDHAVPSAFVRLDEVPLAASAKADPDALPAPTRVHRRTGEQVPPSTPVEQWLCDVWADALGVESVGVTDDFFDLGGASLPALEVVASIDEHYGTALHDAAVFQHRTIRDLARAVELAREAAGPVADLPHLGGATPLSAGEEAMLFEYRADPDVARLPVARCYTISGTTVDVVRLERAVRDVIAHHAPLHTSYDADRRPLGDAALSFDRLPIADADAFARFAAAQNSVPFDLDDGPLVRVHTAIVEDGHTMVLIGVHHISIDAGTFDELWRQIADRYAGAALPELAHTYAEHGAWQHATVDGSAAFWAERSARRRPAAPVGLQAPTLPENDGYLVRHLDVGPADLAATGGTPFTAALAAAATTLAAFTARRDVELRITASTKDHPQATPIVGYFLNTIPVQFEIDHDAPFAALVEQAMSTVADVLPHRTYPFADIVRDARTAGHELPSTAFVFAYTPQSSPTFPGGRVTQRIVPATHAVADITLFVEEREDGLEAAIEHRGSTVGAAAAKRVLDTFATVVERSTHEHRAPVGTLIERPGDLAGPSLPAPRPNVLSRFVEVASSAPDRPAVVATDRTFTYAELAVRVADLARALTGARRVGIGLHRQADVVSAVLAAQFAGAAYVPLDPEGGPDRLELIADQAGVDRRVVSAAGSAQDTTDAHLVLADHDRLVTDRLVDEAIAELRARADRVEPSTPAYVIFTSGSTGRPRGVEVTHANLAASTTARTEWYDAPPDRFLLTSSIGFDSSVVGLFWTITTGGTIVLPDDDEVHDVDRVGDLIAEHGVTHTLMVPSLYHALLRRRADRLGSLRTAIVAGERCPTEVVTAHHASLPGAALINEYGPTEATVWATAHRLQPGFDRAPIGTPIPGVTVRVVDVGLAPTPIGVAGELLISGPTVTGGYLDDADATAERFVELDGRRWYRTGDRVLRREDDVLEFIGRVDDQLNVGGVRLEPSDVERELRRLTGASDAVVVATGEPPLLIAHVETDGDVDEDELRAALAQLLPSGAVPRRILARPTLPRTVHGKLDRAAVERLPIDRPDDRQESNDAPTAMIDVWRRALARRDVHADTDFFAAGGDSLAAVEVVSGVGELVGREVGIAALLAAPTPAALARAVGLVDASDHRADDEVRLVTLGRGPGGGPVVVMTAAWDDVFGYRALARALGDDITVMALTYEERPGRALITTVDEFVGAALDDVAAAVGEHRPIAVVGWSVGGVVAAELADRLSTRGVQVDVLAAVDTYFPGQQRELWSNRWWKYKSLLRVGATGEALDELRVMAGRRVRKLVARLGRRLIAWSGETVPDEPERTSVGGFPVAALDHPIDRVRTPLTFYAADTTNPDRTIVHWQRVSDALEIVSIEGRHRGFASVMAEDRVHQIADDLRRRLLGPSA